MNNSGIPISGGAAGIHTGSIRAAQAIYQTVSSKQETAPDSRAVTSDTVSISPRGRQLAMEQFQRSQQQQEAAFNRKERMDEASFNREQQRAKADFERQERRKEAAFRQKQQQETREFEQNQQQAEAGFRRQLSAEDDQP